VGAGPLTSSRPLVLLYHGFGERTTKEDPHGLFVPEEAFRAQLGRLRDAGFQPLDLDGYLSGLARGQWPRRSFLLTIDDGYASNLSAAAPLLADFGVPAMLFVPPARLGGTSGWMPQMPNERMLAAHELNELPAFGIELGVHGMDHQDMVGMTPENLRRNVVDAREALVEITGRVPRSFAYPHGRFDAAAIRAVRDAGYAVAFSVEEPAGRYGITRTDVNATDTDRTFRIKTAPWWPYAIAVARKAPRARATAHRVVGYRNR
jgi:peptidoglycan/xylan/chitin deacetylase (PgdA/CDA1 family)